MVADARAGDDAGIRELDGGADAPEALRRQRVDGNDKVGRTVSTAPRTSSAASNPVVPRTPGVSTLTSASAPKAAQPFRWRVAGT